MKQFLLKLYRAAIPKLLALLGFGSTLSFMACYAPAPDDYRIVVFPSHLSFSSDDNNWTQTVTIQTEGEWFVSEVSPYVSVSPIRGNGNSTMRVMIDDNDTDADRTSIIVIKSFEDPNYSDTVYVSQYGKHGYSYK